MHFGELELHSAFLASSPPRAPSKSGTPQFQKRHIAAMHMRYDALCVMPVNVITPNSHTVYID